MTEAGLDAALLLHNRDVLYYAGTVRPAALFVSRDDAALFVRRGLEYARQEATVARVEPMKGFGSVAAAVAESGSTGGVLGTELDLIPAQVYLRLREVLPEWSLANLSPLVLAQRAVKDEEELANARRAAVVADVGHQAALRTIAPGVSELELAAEVEAAMRRAGHEGFQPLREPGAHNSGAWVMSGRNLAVRGGHGLVVTGAGLSPAVLQGPSRRALQPGDLVVVDVGPACAGYTADESRTYVVGSAAEEQRAFFAAVCAAEGAVFEMLRSGAAIAELYAAAEAAIAPGAPPYFAPGSLTLPGFVGHGIGLEIDEPPVLWPRDEARLRAGMTLAIEIEVSASERSMMIKLEDTVVVRPDGYELLTGTPRELLEVEI